MPTRQRSGSRPSTLLTLLTPREWAGAWGRSPMIGNRSSTPLYLRRTAYVGEPVSIVVPLPTTGKHQVGALSCRGPTFFPCPSRKKITASCCDGCAPLVGVIIDKYLASNCIHDKKAKSRDGKWATSCRNVFLFCVAFPANSCIFFPFSVTLT
ncbi:hypothetical protein VTK73DRAFT_4586 [Phialemonium thermophilum]|uniref:Uncharacterized protein n=1 Tax=Phialemonium thermophilum TaxID=223376 RepID=A0ABR3XYV2_9PEZI